MNRDYTNFNVDQLLIDDYFIETTFMPSKMSDAFWTEQIANGLLDEKVYLEAKRILLGEDVDFSLDKDTLFTEIKSSVRRKRIVQLTRYVSAAILLIALSFFYFQFSNKSAFTTTTNVIAQQMRDTSDIVLLSENGEKAITIEGSKATLDFSNDDSLLVNEKSLLGFKSDEVEMHQVVVPYGKQISLILPDQTKLWVNAGSTVKFPTAFVGKTREIYVNGEVYADVKSNKQKPFIFKTKTFDVQVLGTSLNLNAYESFSHSRVTLVEGKVKVSGQKGEFLLSPNQSYVQDASNARTENVGVKYYTSWKDGYYHFRDEKLSEVLDDLGRFYGKEITCETEVRHRLCSGNLSLEQDIQAVLDGIAFTLQLNVKKENNRYILYSK